MAKRRSITLPNRRHILAGASAGLAMPLVARHAFAAWPVDKPLRIIVPFAPAGPVDVVARLVSVPLGEALKTTIVIENRAGAGGNIGIGAVARGDADGYSILMCSSAFMLNPSLYDNVPYDAVADFAAVSEMATSPNVFVANPSLGVSTIADLVALAKKQPDKLNYASPGTGTTPQLSAEVLKVRAGINMAHVSHNGAGPAIQAVLAGTTQIACTALPPAQPHVEAGTLKALAVTGDKRWFALPQVPTMAEAGFKDFVHDTVIVMAAPVKTPGDVVARLAREVNAALSKPDIKEKLQKAGFEVLAKGPDVLAARIAREVPMWKAVVAQTGIKLK